MDEIKRKKFLEVNRNERVKYIILNAKKIRESKFNDSMKKAHLDFINSQFEMSELFFEKLVKTKNGEKKLKNLSGFSKAQVRKFVNSIKL